MFKALIIDPESARSTDVCDALADAGCVDIETTSYDEALALVQGGDVPDIAVLDLTGSDLQRVERLARSGRDLPLLVVCDERHIDSVLLAGAADCVTTPVRTRELLGRIRGVLRDRAEARHRVHRERHMAEAIVTLRREKEDLERLACVDALTGIANRRHALALLASEWGRSIRDHRPLGVVMIDLDCYHTYNEQYGHLGGDECLRVVCEAMVRCLHRPSDLLGRYGGEEFIAMLPETDAVGAKIVAERLRASVEALGIPHAASTCAHVVTITAGFASLRPTTDIEMDRLIAAADGALLRAKAQGRNRIEGDAPLMRPSRVSAQRWQRFEPIKADPWFADRIPSCLREAHAGARTIIDALRANQPLRIVEIATGIRNSARELGLPVVEKHINELERAATASDVTAAREAADALILYVTHIQVIYRRPNDPASLVLSAPAS